MFNKSFVSLRASAPGVVVFFVMTIATAFAAEPAGQAVGSYNAGKLVNATELKREGTGYIHLFHPRNRQFGTQGLVELIETAGAELARQFPDGERLQVGDMSARSGGSINGHGSHTNGLDVDFGYYNVKHKEQPEDFMGGFVEEFVVSGKVTKNFDILRNWVLVKTLVSSGRINRIFVDPAIKTTLCKFAKRVEDTPESVEVLRRLRPWPNHGDHLHVRLTCPAESPDCVPQAEVPPGSGCSTSFRIESLPTALD